MSQHVYYPVGERGQAVLVHLADDHLDVAVPVWVGLVAVFTFVHDHLVPGVARACVVVSKHTLA